MILHWFPTVRLTRFVIVVSADQKDGNDGTQSKDKKC